MSLNQLTSNVRKPWLNIRCNNLQVDGTNNIVGPGTNLAVNSITSGSITSNGIIATSGTIQNLSGNSLTFGTGFISTLSGVNMSASGTVNLTGNTSITSLSTPSANISNLSGANGVFQNIVAQTSSQLSGNTTISNISACPTGSIALLSGTTATYQNLVSTTSASLGGLTTTNTLNVNGVLSAGAGVRFSGGTLITNYTEAATTVSTNGSTFILTPLAPINLNYVRLNSNYTGYCSGFTILNANQATTGTISFLMDSVFNTLKINTVLQANFTNGGINLYSAFVLLKNPGTNIAQLLSLGNNPLWFKSGTSDVVFSPFSFSAFP